MIVLRPNHIRERNCGAIARCHPGAAISRPTKRSTEAWELSLAFLDRTCGEGLGHVNIVGMQQVLWLYVYDQACVTVSSVVLWRSAVSDR